MLNPDEIQSLRDLSIQIINPIQEYIIIDICERIALSGQFTATADYQAFRADTLGVHWKQLQKEIAKRLGVSVLDVERLYTEAAQRSYTDDVRRINTAWPDFSNNPSVRQMTRAAAEMAGRDLRNVTRTMGMIDPAGRELPLKEFYGKAMDYVFQNVAYGVMDYNTAVSIASTRLAAKGITAIGYQSGVKTSLEAAVRRNVMGGLGLMVEQISQHNHDTMGANGWEMSAHAMSAPDHEPYQGRQYTDAEWVTLNGLPPLPGAPSDKPQASGILARRVGTLNCGHTAAPIIIGVSEPQYTPEQLAELARANAEGVTVDEKHYTNYEAAQHQRTTERCIRTAKRQHVAAKATGNDIQTAVKAAKLNKLLDEYRRFSKAAGLRTREHGKPRCNPNYRINSILPLVRCFYCARLSGVGVKEDGNLPERESNYAR